MGYSFGEIIKELRRKRGLTQDDLANELNTKFSLSINKGMVSKWENNLGDPSLEHARIMANFFNTTLDELINVNRGSLDRNSKTIQSILSPKEERDIAKDLERMLLDLESSEALAFNGEPMDEETKRLFHISLENSMRLAKEMAKQKFTPNKHKM